MSVNQLELQFNAFAEKLFKNDPNTLKPNMYAVDIEFDDDSQTSDFLFDLFSYGFNKKLKELDTSSIVTPKMEAEFFETILNYLRAIGFETTIHEIFRDSNGQVCNMNISFSQYT
jgi:hypothetical protein